MSRVSDILERLEAIAKKLEMSIEDAVAVLEGKHETHCITTKIVPVAPIPNGNVAAQAAPSTASAPTAAAPAVAEGNAPSAETTGVSDQVAGVTAQPGLAAANPPVDGATE